MGTVIIDTNVMVVANGVSASPQATQECTTLCQARLADILTGSDQVLLDDKKRMIQEYKNNLNEKGRRYGDRFWQELVRWIWNPSRYPGKVVRAQITPLADNGTDFAEFPNEDAALATFHKKDRKFIAVARAYQQTSGQAATILLAIDRGWLDFVGALAAHGVAIDFLCEADIQRLRLRETEDFTSDYVVSEE